MKKIRDYYYAALPLRLGFFVRSAGHFQLRPGDHEPEKIANFGEIFWCIEGQGVFESGGRKFLLRPRHFWYYPPSSHHVFAPGPQGFHYRWLSIEGPDAGNLFRSFRIVPGINYGGECPQHLFSSLELKLQQLSLARQLTALALALNILCLSRARPPARSRSMVEDARAVIDSSFSDPELNVGSLAGLLHVHRVSLSRAFRAAFGVTVSEYLLSARLREALKRLHETDLPAKIVAEQCGFSSPIYFSRVVSRVTGFPPGHHRK